MIIIPDELRRPAEVVVERDELKKQLAEARAEIECKDRLFRQTWGALLFCRRIGYPCRGSSDEFSDVNDFAVQIQKAYSLELLNTLINAAEKDLAMCDAALAAEGGE